MLRIVVLLLVTAALLAPTVAAPAPRGHGLVVTEIVRDEDGALLSERGHVAGRPDVAFERHHFYAKGGGKGAPGGGNGGGGIPDNDCQATQYRLAGWRWNEPYAAHASQHADLFALAGAAWDAETPASLFAGVTPGVAGVAGAFDGVNQIGWADLGATGTIAVTTTWYYRGSGLAVESDAQYNTRYAWATDGRADAMDVLNVATHEIGHALGLDHPKGGGGIACLTMYAYADFGETQKGTLGSGDVYGIRALYGA